MSNSKISLTEAHLIGNNTYSIEVNGVAKDLGNVLGSAIRRILISSMPGAAIVGAAIDGVYHEYVTIDGVQEDVVEVLLNLKGVAVSLQEGIDEATLYLDRQVPGILRAKDIRDNSYVTIHNPNHVIANLSNGELFMEIKVKSGRGFVPAKQSMLNNDVGLLNIDASFSPIEKVYFSVDNLEDSDNVKFTIVTKGITNVSQLLEQAVTYFYEQLLSFAHCKPCSEIKNNIENARNDRSDILNLPIEFLDLTVRSTNCLKSRNIHIVSDLLKLTENELLQTPNLGKKSLLEIKNIVAEKNLSFSG